MRIQSVCSAGFYERKWNLGCQVLWMDETIRPTIQPARKHHQYLRLKPMGRRQRIHPDVDKLDSPPDDLREFQDSQSGENSP